ncbi:MAG: homing endonuclease [Parcubacteria group bacterium]|nr:homing endonuclease [Parcubacteria group bacterium]
MGNTVGSLTQLQRSIIIGTILGDGYLRIVSGRKGALLEVNHALSQKEYVDWKYTMLKPLCKSGPKIRATNGTRVAYRFTTRQHPEITALHQSFYGEGKKSIPDNLVLDPIMLAVWFMDDGSRCRASDVYLNTQQFSLIDQEQLRAMLLTLGIESSLNKDKEYSRIRIKKSSIPLLFELISPYVISSMTYKLGYDPVETCFLSEAESLS